MISMYQMFQFHMNERSRANAYLEIIAKCALYFVGIVATTIGILLYLAEAWIGLIALVVATLLVAATGSSQKSVNLESAKLIGESDSSSSSPNNTLREDGGTPPLAPRLSASSSESNGN